MRWDRLFVLGVCAVGLLALIPQGSDALAKNVRSGDGGSPPGTNGTPSNPRSAQPPPAPKPVDRVKPGKSPVFSAEELAILDTMSAPYFKGGPFGPAYPHHAPILYKAGMPDLDKLSNVGRDAGSPMRSVSGNFLMFQALQRCFAQHRYDVTKAFTERFPAWEAKQAGVILDDLVSKDRNDASWHDAVGSLDELIAKPHQGTQTPQEAAASVWGLCLLRARSANTLLESMRELADARGSQQALPQTSIRIVVDPFRQYLGGVMVINRTDKPIRNCLIVTQGFMDKERIRSADDLETVLSAGTLATLGFSKKVVAGSVIISQLRKLFCMEDRGTFTFVAEIPQKGNAIVPLVVPNTEELLNFTEVRVSIWCDDGRLRDITSEGLDHAKELLRTNTAPYEP